MSFRRQPHQGGASERPGGQVEGYPGEVADQVQGGRLPLARAELLDGGDLQRPRGRLVLDDLHRHAGLVPEGGAQRLVPDQCGVPCLLQRAGIERTVQPQRPGDVVGGFAGVHLGQQPHLPLAE